MLKCVNKILNLEELMVMMIYGSSSSSSSSGAPRKQG